MPKRKYKARKRIDSSAIQGDESYVVMRAPTWDDIENILGDNGSLEDISEMEAGKLLIKDLVEEWNWVDDDDKPLPAPGEEIFHTLPLVELMWLVELVDLSGLEPKKSKTSPKK